LRSRFGEAFDRYCERVPAVVPAREPMLGAAGRWRPEVIKTAESKTFVTFGAMLAKLAFKSLRA
jgi:hypothetical protein